MFGDINKVDLMGNISSDISVRYTNNKNAVASFTLATNRRIKDGENWKDEVMFHNIVVWGKRAEQLELKAKKGTRIFIQGRLSSSSWEKDGKRQYKTEIVAENVILIDRYIKSSEKEQSFQEIKQSRPSKEDFIGEDGIAGITEQENKNNLVDVESLPF